MITSVGASPALVEGGKERLVQGRWAPAPSEVTCATEIHTSQLFRHRQQLCEHKFRRCSILILIVIPATAKERRRDRIEKEHGKSSPP